MAGSQTSTEVEDRLEDLPHSLEQSALRLGEALSVGFGIADRSGQQCHDWIL
jgi:hypothetical protein